MTVGKLLAAKPITYWFNHISFQRAHDRGCSQLVPVPVEVQWSLAPDQGHRDDGHSYIYQRSKQSSEDKHNCSPHGEEEVAFLSNQVRQNELHHSLHPIANERLPKLDFDESSHVCLREVA